MQEKNESPFFAQETALEHNLKTIIERLEPEEILKKYPRLLTSSFLNELYYNPDQSKYADYTNLIFLVINIHGINLLINHSKILGEINPEETNITLLSALTKTASGINFLNENRNLLTPKNLNQLLKEDLSAGIIALVIFAAHPEDLSAGISALGGFATPIEHRSLIQNPDSLSQVNLNAKIRHDSEITLLWLLANFEEGRELLIKHPSLLDNANLNTGPMEGPDKGKTVLWYLAGSPQGLQFLINHPDLLDNKNVNTGPMEGPHAGITVLWRLARSSIGRQFLIKHPSLLDNANLNTGPMEGPHAGITVLWALTSTIEGLQFLIDHPGLLDNINLNTGPMEGPDTGKTVLWYLAGSPQGLQFLINHPDLLDNKNLNTGPMEGPHAGITVLWLLARSSIGRQFLIKHPSLLDNANLNAGPIAGPDARDTVLWLLADTEERRLVPSQNPALFASGYLDIGPTQDPKKGQSVSSLLTQVLKEKNTIPQHSEYATLKKRKRDSLPQNSKNEAAAYLVSKRSKIDAASELPNLIIEAAPSHSNNVVHDGNDHQNRFISSGSPKQGFRSMEPPYIKLYHETGIASKYLTNIALPQRPVPPASDSKKTVSQELSFLPVSSLPRSNEPAHRHPIQTSHWEMDLYSLQEHVNPCEITTFVCAGRKENALIPPLTQSRVALICTEEELPVFLAHLSPSFDLLVIKKMNSQYNGDYQEHLGTITVRRLAAFLFAYEYTLNEFILLDDNIKNLAVPSLQITPSWHELFGVLKDRLSDIGCISVATGSGRAKASTTLGSKFFMINMARIRELIHEEAHLFFLFPEATQARKWGEDYYFQIVLDYLFEGNKKRGFSTLPASDIHLVRAIKHRNAFAASGIKARSFDEPMNLKNAPPSWQHQVRHAIKSLNNLIEVNRQRHANYEKFLQQFNLLRCHAAANHIDEKPSAAMALSLLKGNDFKTNFYNLINHYDYTKSALREYQKKAIQQVTQAYQFPSRFVMATGSGKTLIQSTLALMAWHASMENTPVFIVTPHINLVNQFYEDLIRYNATLSKKGDALSISNEAVLKLSSDSQSVCLELFGKNRWVKQQKTIIICCEKSFKKLMAQDEAYVTSASLVLFDEYHAYSSQVGRTCTLFAKKDAPPITIASSATPPKPDRIPNTLYSMSIQDAFKGAFHASIVACSFNLDYSKANVKILLRCLPDLLQHQYHPGIEGEGLTLAETKGIIYVPSIKVSEQLCAYLLKANIRAYAVHSKVNKKEHDKQLKEFVTHSNAGVLIAVEKLRFGFDCPDLAWEIIARKPNSTQPEQDIEQMVGRVIRKTGNKIGYVLSFQDIHNQYIAPLMNEQRKQLSLAPEFLANEPEYHLDQDNHCVVTDNWDDEDELHEVQNGTSAPKGNRTLKIIPYTCPIKDFSLPVHDMQEKEEKLPSPQEEEHAAVPSSLEHCIPLFNAIAQQQEEIFRTELKNIMKTYMANHLIPRVAANDIRNWVSTCSPTTLLVHDFFKHIPAIFLVDLLNSSEAKYFIALLNTCSGLEREQLIQSATLDELWRRLNLVEMQTLIYKLAIYRSPQSISHIASVLLRRAAECKQEESAINALLSYYISKCIQNTPSNMDDNLKTQLKSIKNTLDLEEENVNPVLPQSEKTKSSSKKRKDIGFFHSASSNKKQNNPQLATDGVLSKENSVIQENTLSFAQSPYRSVPPLSIFTVPKNYYPSNQNYYYEAEDINIILEYRMKGVLPTICLSAVQLESSSKYARIGETLKSWKIHAALTENTQARVLIPINDAAKKHWVGMQINWVGSTITKLIYFDGFLSEQEKLEQITLLYADLQEAQLIGDGMSIEYSTNVLPQTDLSSCGPILIEAFYCENTGKSWSKSTTMNTLRERHLRLLKDEDPTFFHQFGARQELNQSTVHSIAEQERNHGL
ncbi:DEAD/DEAH box helicase [Legionella rowbothamii]|uniref:DEAD/DEAH box helicase n=1 Tax=Legionella rowbothamii TaxID=96229 RepID=UPI0013EFA948|nr:DEAD/DEAH box helicase family protein [Legionella rowbothamii]